MFSRSILKARHQEAYINVPNSSLEEYIKPKWVVTLQFWTSKIHENDETLVTPYHGGFKGRFQ